MYIMYAYQPLIKNQSLVQQAGPTATSIRGKLATADPAGDTGHFGPAATSVIAMHGSASSGYHFSIPRSLVTSKDISMVHVKVQNYMCIERFKISQQTY